MFHQIFSLLAVFKVILHFFKLPPHLLLFLLFFFTFIDKILLIFISSWCPWFVSYYSSVIQYILVEDEWVRGNLSHCNKYIKMFIFVNSFFFGSWYFLNKQCWLRSIFMCSYLVILVLFIQLLTVFRRDVGISNILRREHLQPWCTYFLLKDTENQLLLTII